ncbi:MAG: hypothetical protein JJV97_02835 [SAR324 cluster bacterium]|nr:hypothetical protein [SAR324 cluster bacterium]
MFYISDKSISSLAEYRVARTTLLDLIYRVEAFVGSHPELSRLIIKAKDEFSALAGKLHTDGDDYNNRIKSFLNWFLFDWKISSSSQKTPFEVFMKEAKLDSETKQYCVNLVNHQYSLFLMDKKFKSGVRLKNLYNKKKLLLADLDGFEGIESGDWIETRIFTVNGCNLLGNYMIIHPALAYKTLHKRIKKSALPVDAWQELILKLHNCHAKWRSYKKIDVSFIYKF